MQRSPSSWKGIGRLVRSDSSSWTRNGKPASPLRKRSRRRSGRSGIQLDGAEQEQKEKKEKNKEEEKEKQGRNEKGVAKRNETGPPAKGEKRTVHRRS